MANLCLYLGLNNSVSYMIYGNSRNGESTQQVHCVTIVIVSQDKNTKQSVVTMF